MERTIIVKLNEEEVITALHQYCTRVSEISSRSIVTECTIDNKQVTLTIKENEQ